MLLIVQISQRPRLGRKVVARPCGGLRLFRVLGSAGSSRHAANRRGGRSPCTTESRRSKGGSRDLAAITDPTGSKHGTRREAGPHGWAVECVNAHAPLPAAATQATCLKAIVRTPAGKVVLI